MVVFDGVERCAGARDVVRQFHMQPAHGVEGRRQCQLHEPALVTADNFAGAEVQYVAGNLFRRAESVAVDALERPQISPGLCELPLQRAVGERIDERRRTRRHRCARQWVEQGVGRFAVGNQSAQAQSELLVRGAGGGSAAFGRSADGGPKRLAREDQQALQGGSTQRIDAHADSSGPSTTVVPSCSVKARNFSLRCWVIGPTSP